MRSVIITSIPECDIMLPGGNVCKQCITVRDVQEKRVIAFGPPVQCLRDHTSMLCLPGLFSARSDSCNLRTSQKEVKLVGQLILWIRLLWLGQVGLCLVRA